MERQFRRVSSGLTPTAAQLWASRHSLRGLRPKPSPSPSSPVRALPRLHQRRLWLGSQDSPQLSTNGLRGSWSDWYPKVLVLDLNRPRVEMCPLRCSGWGASDTALRLLAGGKIHIQVTASFSSN